MLKLGIIGAGSIGTLHIENIVTRQRCPNITVAAVADRRESRRAWVKEIVPGAAVFEKGSQLIRSGLVDAVLIAVPHYQHTELAIDAMEHGLHVMCEKPAGVYTLQVREMNAVADAHPELVFGLMFNQRTNCTYRKVKEMLQAGELGQIKRMSWIITDWYRSQCYYDSGSWRATWAGEGGGVLINQCPHQLDLVQWLFGMPTRVSAHVHMGKWHDIEVEDDVTAYMEFPDGATGVLVTSTGDAPGTNRLEISGTKGKLVCEDKKLIFYKLAQDEREWCATTQTTSQVPEYTVIDVETDGVTTRHAGVLNAFADCIEQGTPLVADGREGINSLMLSNAMYLSGWTGEAVSLPIDEEKFLALLNERRAVSRVKQSKRDGISDTNYDTL